jgi:alpha-glutamyl/putrescinyl thymine pyrophosphorylase clade 1
LALWNACRVPPGARDEVYRTYWWFASERQHIFEKRARREPDPWTEDQILSTYKFCNTFRASDRVSQFLIREVIYGPGTGTLSGEDLLFRIVLFRLFSRESTWRLVEDELGALTVKSFDADRLDRRFENELAAGRPLYTHAFILCANKAFGYDRKHRNHFALLETMLHERALYRQLARARSLRAVYEALRGYPLLGPFMAYQLAIDLNYSELIDFSEDEFTVAGPGAERGIRKVFADRGGLGSEKLIRWMVDHQQDECDRLGITPPALYGRPLQAIDCQGLFCEVDKYSRVAFPHLRSNRKAIKATFTPSREPLPLFYPPKWQLNDKLPTATTAHPHHNQEQLFALVS